jgi:hypothetical protein
MAEPQKGRVLWCENPTLPSGGENAVMFFRPAFWGVLKFHEIETGEVDEDYVLMLERTGSEIATDYREVMRKLRGAASQ